jgi:hypothetical protein
MANEILQKSDQDIVNPPTSIESNFSALGSDTTPSPAEVLFGQVGDSGAAATETITSPSNITAPESVPQPESPPIETIAANDSITALREAMNNLQAVSSVEYSPPLMENAFAGILNPTSKDSQHQLEDQVDAAAGSIDEDLAALEAATQAIADQNKLRDDELEQVMAEAASLGQESASSLVDEDENSFVMPTPPENITQTAAEIAAREAEAIAAMSGNTIADRVDKNEDFVGNNDTKISGGRTGGEVRRGEEFTKPKVYDINDEGQWVDADGQVATETTASESPEAVDLTSPAETALPSATITETATPLAPEQPAQLESVESVAVEPEPEPAAETTVDTEVITSPDSDEPTAEPTAESTTEPAATATVEAEVVPAIQEKEPEADSLESTAYLRAQAEKYVVAFDQRELDEQRQKHLMELRKIHDAIDDKTKKQTKLLADLSTSMGLEPEKIIEIVRSPVDETEGEALPLAA